MNDQVTIPIEWTIDGELSDQALEALCDLLDSIKKQKMPTLATPAESCTADS